MRTVRVKVDPDLCIGAASCVTITPEFFQLNEENKVYVYDHGEEPGGSTYERELTLTDDEYEQLLLSAQSCPTLAIFVYDEAGTQVYPEA